MGQMINAAKACELSLAETIIQFGELGDDVAVRCWQSLVAAAGGDTDLTRRLPCLDIRFAPPMVDENSHTLSCLGTILCIAKGADDEDHSAIVRLYEAVQGVCDSLYGQSLNTAGDEYNYFSGRLTANATDSAEAVTLSLGGFTFGDGLEPFDDDGEQKIGIAFRVHFSRTDF